VTAAYTTHARYTRPQRDVDNVCIEVCNSAVKLHPVDIIQLKIFGGTRRSREHEKKKEKKQRKKEKLKCHIIITKLLYLVSKFFKSGIEEWEQLIVRYFFFLLFPCISLSLLKR